MDYKFKALDNWIGTPTKNPQRSRFKTSQLKTLEILDRELRHLNAKQILILCDVDARHIRLDGMLRADARPRSPGIVLAFNSKYGPLKYATDVFDHWKDNLYAIALGLEALRKVDRYGVTKKGEQYKGFLRLAASSSAAKEFTLETAIQFINGVCDAKHVSINIDNDLVVYRVAYRSAASLLHPDRFHNSSKDEKRKAQADFCKLQDAKKILDAHHGL